MFEKPPLILSSRLTRIPNIRHGFFTREGGHSSGIFGSLNCGVGSGDDPANVVANRAAVARALGVAPEQLVGVHQVHGTEALIVDEPFPGERPRADALVTATPGLALGLLTADCGPILFASADGKVIGAAHAGWKGALHGIVESTVAAMETLGAERDGIRAVIGPCIGGPSYQVGPEFRDGFAAVDVTFDRFFLPDGERYRFDIAAFIALRLEQAGIAHVDGLGGDTYADPRFFSYRRATHAGESDYGRQISAIAIGSA